VRCPGVVTSQTGVRGDIHVLVQLVAEFVYSFKQLQHPLAVLDLFGVRLGKGLCWHPASLVKREEGSGLSVLASVF
jgi:hypothetical protein